MATLTPGARRRAKQRAAGLCQSPRACPGDLPPILADLPDGLAGLVAWRVAAKLTQGDIAAAVGCSRGHVALVEQGQRELPGELAAAWITVLSKATPELVATYMPPRRRQAVEGKTLCEGHGAQQTAAMAASRRRTAQRPAAERITRALDAARRKATNLQAQLAELSQEKT